eukprot:scaffold74411_cov48-Attheya_sp.AAC.2
MSPAVIPCPIIRRPWALPHPDPYRYRRLHYRRPWQSQRQHPPPQAPPHEPPRQDRFEKNGEATTAICRTAEKSFDSSCGLKYRLEDRWMIPLLPCCVSTVMSAHNTTLVSAGRPALPAGDVLFLFHSSFCIGGVSSLVSIDSATSFVTAVDIFGPV